MVPVAFVEGFFAFCMDIYDGELALKNRTISTLFFLTEEAKYNRAHSAGVIGSESVLARWCLKGFRGEFTLGYNITAESCCTNHGVNLSGIAEDFVILKCSDLCRHV